MGRRRKKGRPISGILLLNKAQGVTSNKALQQCKWLFDANKAGHTGSLDPMATGVLPLCFGEATKFSQYLLNADKTYFARIQLGQKTDTADAEGDVIESQSVPDLIAPDIVKILESFLGESKQIPPMYSALKKDGQPLYKLARQGEVIEREPRQIYISQIKLCGMSAAEQFIEIEVTCSKGTYIRVLAEDIAKSLGTLGHLTVLTRLAVSEFHLDQTLSFERLEDIKADQGLVALDDLLIPPEKAINHLPMVEVQSGEGYYVRLGQAIFVPNSPLSGLVRISEASGEFLGVGEMRDDGKVHPKRLVVKP